MGRGGVALGTGETLTLALFFWGGELNFSDLRCDDALNATFH